MYIETYQDYNIAKQKIAEIKAKNKGKEGDISLGDVLLLQAHEKTIRQYQKQQKNVQLLRKQI